MNDNQQRDFIIRVYYTTGLLVAVVSVGLSVGRQWSFLMGFVAGALLAIVMLYSVVLLSSAMVGRTGNKSAGHSVGRGVVALQVGKYALAIGGLYLLITYTQISGVGIAVGYGTPLAVLVLTGLTTDTKRNQIRRDR